VSGDRELVARVTPLLAPMTGKLIDLGTRVDRAAAFKLLGNLLLMAFTAGFTDIIALAKSMNLTPEEAVWAATRGSALAIEASDLGSIVAGARADLIILDAPSYRHIPYRPGTSLVRTVIKGGVVVCSVGNWRSPDRGSASL